MSAASYLSLGVIKVGVDGSLSPNFSLIIYYVIAILVLINVYKWLLSRGQTIAAALSIPLIFLVFYFFYLRWFGKKSKATPKNACTAEESSEPKNRVPFPPIVNMCPDFMVTWTDPNGKIYCYDANNTYDMKAANTDTTGLTPNLTINGVPGQSAYMILNPSQNTTAKKITDDSGGLRWPMYKAVETTLARIAADSKGKYLRWEGILEGTGQTYNAWKQNMARVLPSSS